MSQNDLAIAQNYITTPRPRVSSLTKALDTGGRIFLKFVKLVSGWVEKNLYIHSFQTQIQILTNSELSFNTDLTKRV